MDDWKIWLGAIAALMSVGAHVPYMSGIVHGTNKPHIFTWIIWTLLTAIAYVAQLVGHAGAGAWSTGMTIIMCVIITAMAAKSGERDITKSDWIMFLSGVATIPVWLLTSDPLYAVLMITAIDALAFGPTFRKSWQRPHQENTTMYGINIVRHAVAIAAIANISVITTLYPVMLLVMNAGMYIMLKYRRLQKAAS